MGASKEAAERIRDGGVVLPRGARRRTSPRAAPARALDNRRDVDQTMWMRGRPRPAPGRPLRRRHGVADGRFARAVDGRAGGRERRAGSRAPPRRPAWTPYAETGRPGDAHDTGCRRGSTPAACDETRTTCARRTSRDHGDVRCPPRSRLCTGLVSGGRLAGDVNDGGRARRARSAAGVADVALTARQRARFSQATSSGRRTRARTRKPAEEASATWLRRESVPPVRDEIAPVHPRTLSQR